MRSSGLRMIHLWIAWGGILLGVQTWTWLHFFTAGPGRVTPPADTPATSLWAARACEGLALSVAAILAIVVVRQVRREGRLTFDAKFCIAGLLTYWCDPLVNFLEPIFLQSSTWTNVADWTGHVPFLVNPEAGELPEPFLFLAPLYTFGFLLFAMLLNALMRGLRSLRPTTSDIGLVAFAFAVGAALEVAIEIPIMKAGLWAFPGSPDALAFFPGTAWKMPWPEWFTAGMVFSGFSAVRFFQDQDGRRFTERNLENLPARIRTAASTVAMVGILNTLMISASLLDAFVGLYSAPYPELPAHIVNGACDAPGFHGTAYGPCPGSPDFRMPLRDE